MAGESAQSFNITLPTIVSGHANLVYAGPLLLVSLVLTFVGTFLTLDRTRSFSTSRIDHESVLETSKPSTTKSKFLSWWALEGGIGGLCGGWAFATGRFKLVALAMIGLAGGVGFAMILAILLHPSLVTRQVFVAILAPITAIMSLLPIVRTQHGALRFASAAAGSFGSVLSITLLAHKSSWQDIWERLWLPAAINNDWGTAMERGFTALAFILLVIGALCDWFLHRKFGENPEEKWDAYLSKFSENVPSASDRAGIFKHSKSWWQKVFYHDSAPKLPTQYAEKPVGTLDFSGLPSKKRGKKAFSKRSEVKFRPLGDYSDSESESESEFKSVKTTSVTVPELRSPPPRPWLSDPTSPSLSGPTLYGSDDELDNLDLSKKNQVDLESYSDSETDIADTRLTSLNGVRSHRDEPGWKPVTSPIASLPPPGAVPMTPSLIRAIDRIAIAQSELAFMLLSWEYDRAAKNLRKTMSLLKEYKGDKQSHVTLNTRPSTNMAPSKQSELIDGHVSADQSKKAVVALMKYTRSKLEKEAETELLPANEQHVWLVLAVKKMQPLKKLKPHKIPLKYPLVDPRNTAVCLITKDPQREYKDLLEAHNIKFISRVVGVQKLKGKFKGFDARRLLLRENGLFLADDRVIPLLPGLLGKLWFKAKKQPIPVSLTKKELKAELENAISSTYMHQNQGTCTSIKIATLSHDDNQIFDNIKVALPAIVARINGGWDNVQSLHIKTSNSVSLPIWTCPLGNAQPGNRWDGMMVKTDEEGGKYEEDWTGFDSEIGEKKSEDALKLNTFDSVEKAAPKAANNDLKQKRLVLEDPRLAKKREKSKDTEKSSRKSVKAKLIGKTKAL
ncbi:hypothetical protein Clacol_009897 [Clathrus columnatus]|uniref:Ribosomal L1 domain-containing protein 1 n=1 Tax=Clathrus columnatus TaxID=1419009 RepID=A0AAV5AR37_9AGAM|nr:hypothetical protein Clacol_009897 [Clathrus columnatus]